MVRVFRLVRECLSDFGVCFINVGDTYADDTKWGGATGGKHVNGLHGKTGIGRGKKSSGIPAGNLCLIPWRLAIALQEDGWYVRSVVAWTKPAPMPQSISGWAWRRCRVKVASGNLVGSGKQAEHRLTAGLNERTAEKKAFTSEGKPHGARHENGKDFASHAQWQDCPGCQKCEKQGGFVLRKGSWRPTSSWEPILMLAKTADYFSDGEGVKTKPAASTIGRDKYTRILDDPDEQFAVRHDHESVSDGGANLRDTWKTDLEAHSKEELIDLILSMQDRSLQDHWRMASEPLKEKHYASFPSELPRRCIKASTSEKGNCPACGMPWTRVVESRFVPQQDVSAAKGVRGANDQKPMDESNGWEGMPRGNTDTQTIGWRPSCLCIGGELMTPRPPLVLDPFCGSGRTGVAAQMLGCDFVGCELNEKYCVLAEKILGGVMPLFQ